MSTTTQTKHEVKPEFYVFRFDANRGYKLPEQLSYNPELEAGLEVFIKKCGYHLLPGLSPVLETYESQEAADEFLIVAHYEQEVLAIFAHDDKDYSKFMGLHLPDFSIWPHRFLPKQKPAPNNYVYAGPMFKPAYPRF